jgi:serine/threonine protein kinase
MVTTNRCATPQELTMVLHDRCEPNELTRWTEHIESCAACHSQLSSIAAPAELWDESRQQLIESDAEDDGPTSDPPPKILAHYRVEGVIGYGGMATVYRGFDPQLNRPVAIKILHEHLAKSGNSRQRFLREAQSAAAISHPNVVPIYGVHQSAGKTFLVMPLVSGGSLQQRIDREGPLPLADAINIALQIAESLQAAHARGVIHRDVKPANILLEDGNKRVVLSDFGLARTLDDASITASGLIAGTPAYMSPEQARGETVDYRTDLYSLGSVLFAMCTGHAPFQSTSTLKLLRDISDTPFPSVRRYQEQLPAWVDQLISHLTAPKLEDRVASASQVCPWMRECLLHTLNSDEPLPVGLRSNPEKTMTRKWASWGLAAIVLSMSAIALGLQFGQSPSQSDSQQDTIPGWQDPLDQEIQELKTDIDAWFGKLPSEKSQ